MKPDSFTITRVNILGILFQSHSLILYFLLLLSLHHGNILVFVILLHARGHYLLKYQHLSGPYLCLPTKDSDPESHAEGLLSRDTVGDSFFLPGFFPKAVPKTRFCFQDVQIGKHESGKWRKPIYGALWSPGWDIRARFFQGPLEELCKM